MAVTMKDVAKKAGVSIKTVSRVINKQGEISEETRQNILQIIEELGYRPNRLARSLLTGKTYTIGVIISDITDPFFPDLLLGAEQAARERNFNVFLCNANRDPDLELHYVNVLKDRRVDGLLLAGSRLQEEGLKNAIKGMHAVALSAYAVPEANVFSISEFDASMEVGSYLLSLGHRQVAYIDGGWAGSSQNRRSGFMKAFHDANIAADQIITVSALPATVENGHTTAVALLSKNSHITAIACYNDMLAIGTLLAARDVGLKVPDDLSVIGFDDIPEANRSNPPLTTVHFDRYQLGVDMMDRLLNAVDKKSAKYERIPVEGYLLQRQSCKSIDK